MVKFQFIFFYLTILIIESNASPFDGKIRSYEEEKIKMPDRWSSNEYSFASKPAKFPLSSFRNNKFKAGSSNDFTKIISPSDRQNMIELLNIINSKKLHGDNDSPSKSMTSLYPKCHQNENSGTNEETIKNDENKFTRSKYLPLYFDLRTSAISQTDSIFKSNLRVYLKQNKNCECKLETNEDQNQVELSLYEVLSFREVPKRRIFPTHKFNLCCEQKITFNLTRLVQKWVSDPSSNNGILLELSDNLDNKLNANDYIHNMNCSDKSVAKPNMDLIYPTLSRLIRQTSFYPTLDVAFFSEESPLKMIF